MPGAVTYRPNELTTILLKQGLGDGVVIKLTVCYGGGTYGSPPNGHEDVIYAKKLAVLIAGFKTNVIVGGYAGELHIEERRARGPLGDNMHPTNLTVMAEGKQDLAKVNLRYYDGSGTLAPRPGKAPRVRGVNL